MNTFLSACADAVGAVTVHGICGAWGTLAAGLFDNVGMFSPSTVGIQLLGIVAAFVWTFPVSYAIFWTLEKSIGLRVNGMISNILKKIFSRYIVALPAIVAISISPVLAQELSLGADMVSRYVWRGTDFGQSASIQPDLAYTFGGFEIGTWASYAVNPAASGVNDHDI